MILQCTVRGLPALLDTDFTEICMVQPDWQITMMGEQVIRVTGPDGKPPGMKWRPGVDEDNITANPAETLAKN